ncbi:HAD-IA family hydrolase [Halomonas halocynthiae]|uniref:HAD-IA family hydrolase n=1 Tax=Halomonas halocynthiae TaxID=176290 RepID=UPI00041F366D|nr:HAD-IA family hydrolase [Halomonas halocynthiae]
MSTPLTLPAALLFDLDGTLVDTAPDLAMATNALRQHHGLPPLDYPTIRAQVSNGGNALTTLALNIDATHPDHATARDFLLDAYGAAVAVHSRVFPTLEALLNTWQKAGRAWGIVTNKPRRYAEPLVEALTLSPDVLLCADDLPVRKPNPEPLLEAARRLGVSPQGCWYIGDHLRDIEASLAASMPAVAVAYGYLDDPSEALEWQADACFDTPQALSEQLLSLLESVAIATDD